MASTNNPRKRKELENAKESNADSLVSVPSSEDAVDPTSERSTKAKRRSLSEDGSTARSEGKAASRPQRRGDKQATSDRPKVKSHKKVQPGQSGSLSGSIGLSGRISRSDGSTGSMEAFDASSSDPASPMMTSVSGSIDFSGFQERYGDVDEIEPMSEGALAAQEFLQEKQDERELLKERERKRKRRNRIIKWTVGTVVFLIVAAVVAIAVVFSVFRWQTYDDHVDMQGIWKVSGADAQITITEDEIRLTEDVAYKYVIDPDSKTIRFTFGNLVGEGHYRFSLDRSMLSIMDGEYEWGETLSEDAMWTLDALIDEALNDEQKNPSGEENITELTKLADIVTEEPPAADAAE